MVAHVIEDPEKAGDDTAWVSWKKRINLRKRGKNAEKGGTAYGSQGNCGLWHL